MVTVEAAIPVHKVRKFVRTVRVEPEELLGRPADYVRSREGARLVRGRRILVTGAAGSIGSELVRQLVEMRPAALCVLDTDESRMHALQLQLSGRALLDRESIVVACIRDTARIRRVFHDVRPEIVYHAAAHKHLPLLERYPAEGVKTNVLGTHNLVRAAVETGVDRFISISTDKAAEPVSVLGATKYLAECLVQAHADGVTKFASVRFGNVLGSRGSFLDTLRWQIGTGLPITVTHPEVTRFFMTVPEAVSLVIQASILAERGETYVLDMGSPVRIVDLVERYARLADLPFSIEYTGLRPGEKLHEVLSAGCERRNATRLARIERIEHPSLRPRLTAGLGRLYKAASRDDDDAVRDVLATLISGFPRRLVDAAAAPAA